jgi:hypothetical protein
MPPSAPSSRSGATAASRPCTSARVPGPRAAGSCAWTTTGAPRSTSPARATTTPTSSTPTRAAWTAWAPCGAPCTGRAWRTPRCSWSPTASPPPASLGPPSAWCSSTAATASNRRGRLRRVGAQGGPRGHPRHPRPLPGSVPGRPGPHHHLPEGARIGPLRRAPLHGDPGRAPAPARMTRRRGDVEPGYRSAAHMPRPAARAWRWSRTNSSACRTLGGIVMTRASPIRTSSAFTKVPSSRYT